MAREDLTETVTSEEREGRSTQGSGESIASRKLRSLMWGSTELQRPGYLQLRREEGRAEVVPQKQGRP